MLLGILAAASACFFTAINAQSNGLQCSVAPVDSSYSYCVHVPAGNKTQSLLLYLGGSGSRGSYDDAAELSTWSGAGYVLGQQLNGQMSAAGQQLANNFVVVSVIGPTSTVHFDPDVVAGIYNAVLGSYSIDKSRVYIAGYSMGCRGVMRQLVYHNSLYAAAVCVSGYAEQSNSQYIKQQPAPATYPLLKNVVSTPIWFYGSTADTTNPLTLTQATVSQIKKLGGKCTQLTTVKGMSHTQMNYPPFENAGLYTWLLSHARGQKKTTCNQVTSPNNAVKKPTKKPTKKGKHNKRQQHNIH